MSILDPRTLSFVITIVSVLQAGVVIMLYRIAPRYPGVKRWTLSIVLGIVSVTLITLRGFIPAFFSIIVANVLALAGVALLIDGIARFIGRTPVRWPLPAAIIGADLLAYTYWLYLDPNPAARTTLLFLLTALFHGYGATLLLINAQPTIRRAAHFTGAVFAGFTLWSLLRAVALLFAPPNGGDPQFALVNNLAPLMLLLFVMLSTIGLTALVLQRLLGDLQQQEQLFRLTFDQSPVGAAMSGLDTRLVRVNDALCKITGYTRADLLTRTLADITHPDDRARDAAAAHRLRTGEIDMYAVERRAIRHDGSTAWIALWLRMLRGPADAPLNYLAQVEDITARKQAEEARLALERQVLELQKLDSMVLMAGGIAHDFNNLLTTILGNADLALLDLPDAHPAHLSVVQIITAGQRAAGLAKQMLVYAGRSYTIAAALDLNDVVAETISILPSLIPATIMLDSRLSPPRTMITADATQIQQVLLSLVMNAAEAIATAKGQITITTDIRHVERAFFQTTYLAPDLPEGRYAQLQVADTGGGMDSATMAKVFEPFFTTKFMGRGLGLSAVLGIIRSHHGAIHVASVLERGTTVTILLPLYTDTACFDQGLEEQGLCPSKGSSAEMQKGAGS